MFPADLSTLTPEHLDRLVNDVVVESRTIEYKLDLPDKRPDAKKEFLADITAFANALGGHLLLGVEAVDGIPESFPGVTGTTKDELKQRIENLCQNAIEPRLLGLQVEPVQLPSNRFVVVMRILPSWIGPHRVTLGGHGHFYVRDTKGKHPMNTDELRAAFTLSAGLVDRIRAFRAQRVELVLHRNAGPIRLEGAPSLRLLLHLVPLTAFTSSVLIDIDREQRLLRSTHPVTPRTTGSSSAVNLEGHVNICGSSERDSSPGYVQFFRTGIVEHAACLDVRDGHRRRVFGALIEKHVVDGIRRYLGAQKNLGVTPPIYVLLTLDGTAGTQLLSERTGEFADMAAIRNEIELPEAVVDEFDRDLLELLAPTFAIMWNAFGRHRP